MENWSYGKCSRRKFTKEFREEAVRRLELGAWFGGRGGTRAREVNPNVLYRWRRELRDCGVKAFTGNVKQRRGEEQQVAELERKVGRIRRWRSIF